MITDDVFAPCLILTGPTGSGKSALALELAPTLNAEIVCMDSMTLYRGMDIGTAKASAAERARVPHHLLDVRDPSESANVAWWLERAAEVVRDIVSRGRVPLLVGGTPLYLKAVLEGLFAGPPADANLRQQLEADAERLGAEGLHRRLQEVDPQAASRLHPNDLRRVIRALEVFHLTGRPISSWQTQWRSPASSDANETSSMPGMPDRCLCLEWPRDDLNRRINDRVDRMLQQGWLDEVRELARRQPPPGKEARQAIGYRELFDHLEGLCSLDEARSLIQIRSRQFAKRQRTWFRQLSACQMISPELTRIRWGSRIE
ncbi:MAG: tRNA (adenosine(37)-N6)-dimethylallyltransferase MiaA [Gemmataceae bacterium]